MRIGFLLLTFFYGITIASAQQLDWIKRMGGPTPTSSLGVTTDFDGNVITTGYFSGTVDFNPDGGGYTMTSTGGSADIFITKFDSSGNFIWAKTIGGNNSEMANDIAADLDGNLYLTGYFEGPTDFDPSTSTHILPLSYANTQAFVLKLNNNGDFVWVNGFHGNAGYNIGNSVLVTFDNHLLITGCYSDTVDFDSGIDTADLISVGSIDGFISKIDTSGNLIWTKSIGSVGGDDLHSVAEDLSHNIIIAGLFSDSTDFDPGTGEYYLHTLTSHNDIFISKLDASGNFIWARAIPGTTDDHIKRIALDLAGNIYCSGYFLDTVDFDPGLGIQNLYAGFAGQDLFLLKLDNNGNFKWVKQLEGSDSSYAYTNTIISTGNFVILGGFFWGPYDFDPGVNTNYLYSPSPYSMFIGITDTSGSMGWAVQTTGPGYTWANDFAINTLGDLLITGDYTATVEIDPQPNNYFLVPVDSSLGSTNSFLIKLNNDHIGLEQETIIRYNSFPNPFCSLINIQTTTEIKNGTFTLTDFNGRNLLQKNHLNGNNFQFDLSELNAGMYFIHLYSEGKEGIIKVIKN